MNIHQVIEKTLKIDSRYFLGGGFWLLLAQGLTILISLVGTIIFAHYLTATDFGIYRYLISLGVLFGSFTLTGVGQAILQSAARGDTWYYTIGNRRTSQFNLISSAIALCGAIYYLYNDNHTLAIGCALIALLQPSSIYFLNALAFLHGQKKFKEATFLQASRSLLITISSIIAVLLTSNVVILIAVFLGSQAIAGMVSRLQTHQMANRTAPEGTALVRYDQIATHTSLRNIIVGSAARLDSVIVFQQLGAASLATYTIATLLPEHIKGALKNLPTLLIPRFSNRTEGSVPNLKHRTMQGLVILSLFTGMVIAIVPYLYSFIFPKYPEAVFYTQLLALSFPASVYHIHLSWLQTQSEEKLLYYTNVFTSVFQIITTLVGVLFFGLVGAVVAKIATHYMQLLSVVFYTPKN
jgi:O-antigen/teichoic acid export membrane protein